MRGADVDLMPGQGVGYVYTELSLLLGLNVLTVLTFASLYNVGVKEKTH